MANLHGKTIFISGASRGIGKAIALRAARDGAHIVVAPKTVEPHHKLSGTIYTTAQEIEKAGGRALPVVVDVRSEKAIEAAVQKTVEAFGGIDILVNNASAIQLSGTLDTDMKRFDLMFSVNVRATFACSKACLPFLKKSQNPHILNLSPPLNMNARWFSNHLAYTMSKYGMSECVLGMSEEFKAEGIAVNALWPKTLIATSALHLLGGEPLVQCSRKPEIVADAAYLILTRESRKCTGNFFIDEAVLKEAGITDFESYAVDKTEELLMDLFL